MYVLTNGHGYIGVNEDNVATTVRNTKNALLFSEEKKAYNYRANLKSTMRRFNWRIIKIDQELGADVENNSKGEPVVTDLEECGIDLAQFFTNTISTISQLRNYAKNMQFKEQEYNKKIKDVRHYKRDRRVKLNAIQLQRLEQFEIKLERERYECKSNRLIAETFLLDMNRLENSNYVEVIKAIKESEYQPSILSYEFLDGIVGRKAKKLVRECEGK